MKVTFYNRAEAGRMLAARLLDFAHRSDVIVLGLPRGGVPVAAEVARELAAPLDVFIVRKLGFPGQEELALGAIASGGIRVLNEHLAWQVPDIVLVKITQRETQELRRREIAYRGENTLPELRGKIVILIDDGIATGASVRAALQALRKFEPARLMVAAPVAPASTCADLVPAADEVIVLETPQDFSGVGEWYEDFTQTSDEEVTALLAEARARFHGGE